MEFHIENMTCGACVRRITKAIQTLDENAEIIVDTPNRHLKVSTMVMEEDLRDKLVEIGYP
jgi:copper chaperone